jgi:hypothetical protein
LRIRIIYLTLQKKKKKEKKKKGDLTSKREKKWMSWGKKERERGKTKKNAPSFPCPPSLRCDKGDQQSTETRHEAHHLQQQLLLASTT